MTLLHFICSVSPSPSFPPTPLPFSSAFLLATSSLHFTPLPVLQSFSIKHAWRALTKSDLTKREKKRIASDRSEQKGNPPSLVVFVPGGFVVVASARRCRDFVVASPSSSHCALGLWLFGVRCFCGRLCVSCVSCCRRRSYCLQQKETTRTERTVAAVVGSPCVLVDVTSQRKQ